MADAILSGRGPQPGDRIEIRGLPGSSPPAGVLLEVLGEGSHRRYRVRWDERHESVFFPGSGEGVHFQPAHRGRARKR